MLRSAFLVGVAASALGAGCTTDTGDTTILILHNEAPQAGCVATADTSSASLSSGLYDLGLARMTGQTTIEFGYQLTPVAVNESFADTTNSAAVGRRTMIVQGAHVDIAFNDTNTFSSAEQDQLKAMGLTHFDARFGGAIMPNGGLAAFDFEVIPAPIMTAILMKHPATTSGPYVPFEDVGMIATVQLFGNMNGGTIESAQFAYPVTVCDSCLIQQVGPLCSDLPSGFMAAHTGGACLMNQDGVVDCCSGTTGLVCPATPPPAAAAP